MNTQKHIAINDDLSMEIHFNDLIAEEHKPYLVKMFGWNFTTEYRLSTEDILNLSESLADFVFDKAQARCYDSTYSGLGRLWMSRREEALDQIEVLQQKLEEYESNHNNR